MEKLNLYCDVDSTINDHWIRAQKHYGTPQFTQRYVIMQDKPLQNSRETLWEFSDRFCIHYLTARNFIDAYSITKDWLIDNDFPIDTIKVVSSSKEKIPFLLENKVDLFIDDLSADQKNYGSYVILYDDVIDLLNKNNIPYFRFSLGFSSLFGV